MDEDEIKNPNSIVTSQLQNQQPNTSEVEEGHQSAQMKPTRSSYASDFDWNLPAFNEQNALKNFSKLGITEFPSNISNNTLSVVDSVTSGIIKTTTFIIRGEDPKRGSIEIVRKLTDFLALRQAMVRRWPGIIIPPIPDKLTVGVTETQIARNRVKFLNNFLTRTTANVFVYYGEEMQIFLKGAENEVESTLEKLKPHKSEVLLEMYNANFGYAFEDKSQKFLEESEKRIMNFQDYFREKKTDLAYLKDQLKRMAQLKDKLLVQRFKMMHKFLPAYEQICLDWFTVTKRFSTQSQPLKETEGEGQEREENKIYGSEKYKNIMQAYIEELFGGQGKNPIWLIFEIFKFELKQIDTALQAISEYKLLNSNRKFYIRNIENNKQQIQDINSNKTSLKIFFLSGSADEKKTQLANETERYEKQLMVQEELWMGVTQIMMKQMNEFQTDRAKYYKQNLKQSFRMEAVFMGKLFNLYVQSQKI